MSKKNAGIAVIIGGLALVVGSFLVWATRDGETLTGIDVGNGWLTLISGLGLIAFGYLVYIDRSTLWLLAWPFWALGAVIALIRLVDILGSAGIDAGMGLWLVLLGVLVSLVGLIMERRVAAQPQPGAPMPPME